MKRTTKPSNLVKSSNRCHISVIYWTQLKTLNVIFSIIAFWTYPLFRQHEWIIFLCSHTNIAVNNIANCSRVFIHLLIIKHKKFWDFLQFLPSFHSLFKDPRAAFSLVAAVTQTWKCWRNLNRKPSQWKTGWIPLKPGPVVWESQLQIRKYCGVSP